MSVALPRRSGIVLRAAPSTAAVASSMASSRSPISLADRPPASNGPGQERYTRPRSIWSSGERARSPTARRSPAGRTTCGTRPLTTWLNSIPPGDVAKRAGNSVEALLKRYAGCLDGRADTLNRRIERALEED